MSASMRAFSWRRTDGARVGVAHSAGMALSPRSKPRVSTVRLVTPGSSSTSSSCDGRLWIEPGLGGDDPTPARRVMLRPRRSDRLAGARSVAVPDCDEVKAGFDRLEGGSWASACPSRSATETCLPRIAGRCSRRQKCSSRIESGALAALLDPAGCRIPGSPRQGGVASDFPVWVNPAVSRRPASWLVEWQGFEASDVESVLPRALQLGTVRARAARPGAFARSDPRRRAGPGRQPAGRLTESAQPAGGACR